MNQILKNIIKTCLLMHISCLSINYSQAKIPQMRVYKLQKTRMFDQLKYPVQIESTESSTIKATISGKINNLLKKIGSKVKHGQAILSIQNTKYSYSKKPVLQLSTIGGVISKFLVTKGQVVNEDDDLALIVNDKDLILKAHFPGNDLEFLKKELIGSFKSQNLKKLFKVKISEISPIVDQWTGTSEGLLSFLNDKDPNLQHLRVGGLGTVTFRFNERMGFWVKSSSIKRSNGKSFIFISRDDKIEKIQVNIRGNFQGLVEIESNKTLKENELVILNATSWLTDKLLIKPLLNE